MIRPAPFGEFCYEIWITTRNLRDTPPAQAAPLLSRATRFFFHTKSSQYCATHFLPPFEDFHDDMGKKITEQRFMILEMFQDTLGLHWVGQPEYFSLKIVLVIYHTHFVPSFEYFHGPGRGQECFLWLSTRITVKNSGPSTLPRPLTTTMIEISQNSIKWKMWQINISFILKITRNNFEPP